MNPPDARRRGLMAGAGMALAALPAIAAAQQAPRQRSDRSDMLSAAAFGARGDGVADDSAALQAALDAAFAPNGPGFLAIPQGTYKLTRPLRVVTPEGQKGDVGHRHGIIGHGARLVSAIADGGNVLEYVSNATATSWAADAKATASRSSASTRSTISTISACATSPCRVWAATAAA